MINSGGSGEKITPREYEGSVKQLFYDVRSDPRSAGDVRFPPKNELNGNLRVKLEGTIVENTHFSQ